MKKQAVNEFEFLRSLPFGPYAPVDSPLQRLDPRTRILLVVLMMAALTIAQSLAGVLLGLAAVLAAWWLARRPFGPLLRGWRAALPFLLILVIIQLLLRRGGDEAALVVIGPLAYSAADLLSAGAFLLRFFGFIAVLGLAAASISESELTHGLESLLRPLNVLRLPVYDFVAVIQVTLRYFPMLAQTAERIAKAQASRGADWQPAGWNLARRVRRLVPLIVPLFIVSLRRAENMALAMDARAYGSMRTRTSMVQLRMRLSDGIALLGGLALTAAMILL